VEEEGQEGGRESMNKENIGGGSDLKVRRKHDLW
jgi:hypothetical protein